MRPYWSALGILLLVSSLPAGSSADPIVGSTAQNCRGPATLLSPRQTLPLTCNVTSPLRRCEGVGPAGDVGSRERMYCDDRQATRRDGRQ